MLVKPRPSLIGRLFLGTPLEFLATWLPYLLLCVPDMALMISAGVLASRMIHSRSVFFSLVFYVLGYALIVTVRSNGLWSFAHWAAMDGDYKTALYYGTLAAVVLGCPFASALISRLLQPCHSEMNACVECGHPFFGQPARQCPECSTLFCNRNASIPVPELRQSYTRHPPSAPAAWSHFLPPRVFVIRVVAMLVGAWLYYALDWMWLCVLQRDAVAWLLQQTGYTLLASDHNGFPNILVDGQMFYFTKECTYVDLMLVLPPFVFVFPSSRYRNVLMVLITIGVVTSVNMIRCYMALLLELHGHGRFYAHDLPDYFIWWPSVAVAVLMALRLDSRGSVASRTK